MNNATLAPLEKLQNKAMRIILGCPISTRISIMQQELKLAPLTDYVSHVATIFGVKIAKSYTCLQNTNNNDNTDLLGAPATLRSLMNGTQTFNGSKHPKVYKTIIKCVKMQNVNLFSENVTALDPINPTEKISANIHIPTIPSCPENNSLVRSACWLESLDRILSEQFSGGNPLHIYTDGSLITSTGKAGCGIVVYDNKRIVYERSVAQPKWTSNSENELKALEIGISYAVRENKSALIICDSTSALLSLNACKPQHKQIIHIIQRDLVKCSQLHINVQFMWVPSHVGIAGNEKADSLAKSGAQIHCNKKEVISISQFRTILHQQIMEEVNLRMDSERSSSCTIKHYDNFRNKKHFYGKSRVQPGPCDRIAARIRIGYRHVWEINHKRFRRAPEKYSSCVLCEADYSNRLIHYISECSKIEPFRPAGKRFHELCLYFCDAENLLPILIMYPGLKF